MQMCTSFYSIVFNNKIMQNSKGSKFLEKKWNQNLQFYEILCIGLGVALTKKKPELRDCLLKLADWRMAQKHYTPGNFVVCDNII